MNVKQLEDLVAKQAETIETLNTGMNWLREAVAQLQLKNETQAIELVNALTMCGELRESVGEFENAIRGALYGFEEGEGYDYEAEDSAGRARRLGLAARVTEIEALVRGRNSSAPVKRNMVDEDALKVLTGDCKDLDHKTAADRIGLTYAQVYSCRLEYTFKHVHKSLREGGWKNPFIKK